jgi:hypothetical protein
MYKKGSFNPIKINLIAILFISLLFLLGCRVTVPYPLFLLHLIN